MRRVVVGAGTMLGVVGLLVGAALSGPAEAAKHTKPGPVTGLGLTISKASDHYLVKAAWSAYPSATKYVVRFKDASGTTFSPATTTSTTWQHTSYAAVGTAVTVSVTVFLGKVRGQTAQVSALLPDVTPPVGAYRIIRDSANPTNGNVTIQRDSLSDDLTPVADLAQTIDWGDGTLLESWSPLDSQIAHTYPGTLAVYYPTVTVTDLAGNSASYRLVVAVADTQAPTGTFSAGPATGYTGWTTISVVQSALSDDLSAQANITRVVTWGDGTAPESWPAGDTLDHVYSAPGSYTPTVTVTDEAGNSAVIDSTTVTVSADVTAPTLTITKPKRVKSVRAWRFLHGISVDNGVGVQDVAVKIIEKRRGAWYVYKFKTHRWKKIGTLKRAALRKAPVKILSVNDLDHWHVKVLRLRKGVLLIRATSTDNVGNVVVANRLQKLTKR